MDERRKYIRFGTIIEALHRIMDRPEKLLTKGLLKDLSKEGVRLNSESSLEKGSLIELELRIPGEDVPIMAFGRVAWSQKSDETTFDAGIQFTKIKRGDRAKLMDFVYNEWIRSKKGKSLTKGELILPWKT